MPIFKKLKKEEPIPLKEEPIPLKKEEPPQPQLAGFVYTVMSTNDTTHHIFLIDLLTENYKLIRTLNNITRQEALEYTKKLALSSAEELHIDAISLGKNVEIELARFDKENKVPNKSKEKS